MMDYTAIIVAVLGSNLLVEITKAIINRNSPVKEAVFALLFDRLEFLLERALERGYTTNNERKKLRKFLSAYESLGGDDYIHDLWERYKELDFKN